MILASQGLIIAIVIVVILIIIVVGWYISTMNNLRRLEIKVEEAASGIDVSLTKRYDLLTKMLDTTKGYAKHEAETLEKFLLMQQLNKKVNLHHQCQKLLVD